MSPAPPNAGGDLFAANLTGALLALASSAFIGVSFIVKKKGLRRAGAAGARAGDRPFLLCRRRPKGAAGRHQFVAVIEDSFPISFRFVPSLGVHFRFRDKRCWKGASMTAPFIVLRWQTFTKLVLVTELQVLEDMDTSWSPSGGLG
jgi:hypothetical protein